MKSPKQINLITRSVSKSHGQNLRFQRIAIRSAAMNDQLYSLVDCCDFCLQRFYAFPTCLIAITSQRIA